MTAAIRRYGRYAFGTLRLDRLTAKVIPWNDASCRVLEKVRFRYEGRLRNHVNKNGVLVDVFHYGLLREDVEGLTESRIATFAPPASETVT